MRTIRLFYHSAGPAVYRAFIGSDSASSLIIVQATVLALATVEARIASVTELLVETESRRVRR